MANNDYENKPLNTEDIDEKRIAREDFVSEDRSDALDDEARIMYSPHHARHEEVLQKQACNCRSYNHRFDVPAFICAINKPIWGETDFFRKKK